MYVTVSVRRMIFSISWRWEKRETERACEYGKEREEDTLMIMDKFLTPNVPLPFTLPNHISNMNVFFETLLFLLFTHIDTQNYSAHIIAMERATVCNRTHNFRFFSADCIGTFWTFDEFDDFA